MLKEQETQKAQFEQSLAQVSNQLQEHAGEIEAFVVEQRARIEADAQTVIPIARQGAARVQEALQHLAEAAGAVMMLRIAAVNVIAAVIAHEKNRQHWISAIQTSPTAAHGEWDALFARIRSEGISVDQVRTRISPSFDSESFVSAKRTHDAIYLASEAQALEFLQRVMSDPRSITEIQRLVNEAAGREVDLSSWIKELRG